MNEGSTQVRQVALASIATDADDDMAFAAHGGPRPRRRWLRRILVASGSAVLMAGLACAALIALLLRGPIEVGFLSERIALGIERQLGGGVDVDVGRTVLEKSDVGFGLHVLDIVMKDGRGREILRSPDATVSFAPLPLLRLAIVPEKLALRGMAMRAEITPEGEFLFRTTASDAAPVSTAPVADVLAYVVGLGDGSGGGLAALAIDDASLTIEDRRNGKRLSFDRMSLSFGSPRTGVIEAQGSLRKETDVVPFSMLSEPADGGRRLRFAFSGVGDHVLQALLGAKSPFLHLGAKLDASAEAMVGADARVRTLAFDFGMGPGSIGIAAIDPQPYRVNRFAARARWDAASPREASLDVAFEGEGLSMALAGPLSVPPAGWDAWRWQATGQGWRVPPLATGDPSLTVDAAELQVTVDPSVRSAQVHRFAMRGAGIDISLSGDAAFEDHGPGMTLWLEAGRMPLRNALRWWPSFTAVAARSFLVRTVRDGELGRFILTLAMPPPIFARALAQEALPREALKIDVAVEDGVLALGAGLPLLTGLAGQARLDAVEMQGAFHRGAIEARGGRRVQLSDGALSLLRLDTWEAEGRFRFKAVGPMEAVAEVLRSPDLRQAHGLDVDPTQVKGQFDGVVGLSLPLKADLKPAEIVTQVNGRMTGLTVEKAIGKDRLESATLAVSADRSGIEVKGEGRWQGTPVALSLEKEPSDGRMSAVLSMTLDEAALRRRGFGLQGQLSGPLPVKIRTLGGERDSKAQVEVDLTRAVIDGLLPGLQKAAGRPGKLVFDAVERSTGYSIHNIALDVGPSSFRGQAEAAADGTIASARFSLFRLSPGDNVRLDYDRTAAGAKVMIRGNNLDARPFLRLAGEAGKRDADRDLELDLRTTLLSGHGGEVLTGAEAKAVLRAGQPRQLSLTGKLNGRAVSIASRAAGDGGLPVAIDSDDAGALFRWFDLYSRMVGGDLNGQVTVSPRRMAGFVIARDFGLRDEPALRRLVTEGQGDAPRQAVADARFSKMRLDFAREGTETAVKDAVIFGPQLGLTFNGMVDQTRDRVSLSGTYVPAYGLNNAFAQIPLVGNLLTGGRNEGLLAITFGVSGRASQPNVTVNPLSAVAPGIFRKIFEFRNERSGSAPPPAFNPTQN